MLVRCATHGIHHRAGTETACAWCGGDAAVWKQPYARFATPAIRERTPAGNPIGKPQRRFPNAWWVLCEIGLNGPTTSTQVAETLGLERRDVVTIMGRLRDQGLVVPTVERLGPAGFDWVLTEAGASNFAALQAEARRYVRLIEEARVAP